MWKRISLYVTKSCLPGASPAGSPGSLTARSESIIDYLSQSSSLTVHFLQVMVLRFLPSCPILSLCTFLPFPGLQIQSFCSFTSNAYIPLLLLLSHFSRVRLCATPSLPNPTSVLPTRRFYFKQNMLETALTKLPRRSSVIIIKL